MSIKLRLPARTTSSTENPFSPLACTNTFQTQQRRDLVFCATGPPQLAPLCHWHQWLRSPPTASPQACAPSPCASSPGACSAQLAAPPVQPDRRAAGAMEAQELRRALQSQAGIKCGDAALLTQLGAAAGLHGLSAKELASRLGAYLLNQGSMGGGLSSASVEAFVSVLHRECNKENQARGHATPAPVKREAAGKDWGGLADTLGTGRKPDQQALPATPLHASNAATPLGARGGAGTPQSAPRTAFKSRTNRGQVVSTLNAHLPRDPGQEARIVHVEPLGVQLPGRHVYLMERLEDKVAAINARIGAWRKWLVAALGSGAEGGGVAAGTAAGAAAGGEASAASAAAELEVAPVGVPVQEESLFVGRVVCEVEGGMLNDTAVLLEGDTASSGGARVHLDLSGLPSYRLFPGQVIGVRGVNPSGGRILARHLWSHLPPPRRGASSAGAAAACDAMDVDGGSGGGGGSSGGALSAVVAAGPFCVADDLSYEPLHELLQSLKEAPPNLLMLLGPFVDVEQPLIAGGMINVTFQALFQTQVLERLVAWQAALALPCQVVLMPAVWDAFHHPTFPTPAFNLPADQHLVSLQSPCTFAAGPALLGASTSDVLRHLSAAELAKNAPGAPADRLAALASHVVGQRRFYPLYPAPPGTCLDLTGDAALALGALPELLLLPSDLAPFAKLLAAPQAGPSSGGYVAAGAGEEPQVVVINPGRLAKGSGGGTYAHVSMAAGSGSLASRCRVDILRV